MPGNATTEVGRAGRFAMGFLVVLAAANALQAFASTGPPPHIGQGDPIRLSWNPRHWVWGSEETEGKISWRGAWTIPRPAASAVDPNPAHGPLRGLATLPVQQWRRIAIPLTNRLTGFAVDAQGTALVTTDRFSVYVVDSTWTRVLHHVVLDPGFSIDLTPLTGAAFVGGDTLAVLSTNKSYVLLEPDAHADAALEWRHFLQTDSSVTELRRARFATVRARQNYVLSFAYDSAADQLITITVPSARHKTLVISRFDRGDLTLSSEFLPRLREGLAVAATGRGLDDYVITGAAVADGLLYAISAAYSTLLVVDLQTGTVNAAYVVPGLNRPAGLAVRGEVLLVAQADGRVAVIDRPAR
jgi:disulfide bond formation protein DsbB